MSRRDNVEYRCPSCRMHGSLCICALIPRLVTRTRVVLFIHRFEERKPTNTGRLAAACLVNSEVSVRGEADKPSAPFVFGDDTQPAFLFPDAQAMPITELTKQDKPVTLIVPDGTWRQAAKVYQRVPGISGVPKVSLPPGPPTLYRLRAETHEEGLATFEAVARALGILEGSEVQQAMERVFLAKVERTLWSRGQISASEVSGGVPEGALRHDPRPARDRVTAALDSRPPKH